MDLQVKSSPPVRTELQMPSDPAIIQSQYARTTSSSVGGGTLSDLSSPDENSVLPTPAFPSALGSYQAGAHFESWGSSPVRPSTNEASLSMPMYSHGYYEPSSVVPHQAIPLQSPSSSSIHAPVSLQNQFHYPQVNHASLNTIMPNLSEPAAPIPSPIIPSTNSAPFNVASALTPAQIATSPSGDLSLPLSSKVSLPSWSMSYPTANLLAISPSTSNQEANDIVIPVSNKAGTVPIQSLPYSSPSFLGSTSGSLLTVPPALLTLAQLTHLGPPAPSSMQNLYTKQNGMDASVSSSSTPLPPQVPFLPLPLPSQQPQHSQTRFTEEFDFVAMNEKFKKDEVWEHLGKAKLRDKTGNETKNYPIDYNVEDGERCGQASKIKTKPVYVKDDFFDTLSGNALNRGAWNGRTNFSGRMKLDTETFGEFQQRHHWGRGGNSRGSFNRGRGYGYGGRGRGGQSHI
ncbi:protein decapping 5-like isoform X2 [Tasmannia lanceolata]|uniref:protein decapping 5-like isoform X2 n=1 Tax=Tasmannia lanceolata TaxID=3420 RepID=UPI004064A05A